MGLSSDLIVSSQSLSVASMEMEVTSTNLSNSDTSQYARRRAVVTEGIPTGQYGELEGVQVSTVQSLRDSILDLSVNATNSEVQYNTTLSSTLSAVQSLFSDSDTGSVGSAIDSFFSDLETLSSSPTSTSDRTDVLTAAQNVAAAFQSTSKTIVSAQQQADLYVVNETSSANTLLQEIATANGNLQEAKSEGQSTASSEDQLASLLNQLSTIMDYKTVNSSDGLTLTSDNGIPLVVGDTAATLTTAVGTSGYNEVMANGTDITSQISGGTLGGYIEARDGTLTTLATNLDSMAYDFAQAVNNVQTAGSDLNGTAGTAMFDPPDTTSGVSTGAASTITVALTSGSQIAAAASGGASGDNSNLVDMIDIEDQDVVNGTTPSSAFANLTDYIGTAISTANANETSSNDVLTQLTDQQSSTEGVSVDEEAANLILYERTYEAAAKLISTLDTMMANVLNMGASSPQY